ncbi:ABC transporter permease [Marinobacterium lacunae]|uniref:ABC transporter permease n=1 Tax=Marinobacterium lacunae TaxID=1232683 RepID=A0A081FYK2_9GAMM|nr:MFS transporter [Marinobacterium lacunae]KEA63607.1 ABC transporter permease [Marinobacterium lacunae]MBR9884488.1 MFS transporter [Oceanospirillales bacterium]
MSEPFKGPFDGRPLAFAIAIAAILLTASNLRGGIVVVGPLVEDIRTGLGFSASQFSMLTTLPLICFGIVSSMVPALARRLEPPQLVIIGLLLISAGALLRMTSTFSLILIGTLLLGSAIALLNVLIPGLVKGYFPRHPGVMTGLYTVTLGIGAGLGVYLAIPLRDLFDNWRAPMALWAIVPPLCVLPWLYLLRVHTRSYQPPQTDRINLWRNTKAWAVTGYMGLQSTFFYSIITWLPNMLIDNGLSDTHAGVATSLVNLAGIPASLAAPLLATRMKDQRLLVLAIAVLAMAGLGGLLLAPSQAPLLWASLIGISGGAALSLSLTLFALRTNSTIEAVSLSAMAQSVGYMIAAAGPLVIGTLNDLSGSWFYAVALLLALQVLQCLAGLVAGKPGTIGRS